MKIYRGRKAAQIPVDAADASTGVGLERKILSGDREIERTIVVFQSSEILLQIFVFDSKLRRKNPAGDREPRRSRITRSSGRGGGPCSTEHTSADEYVAYGIVRPVSDTRRFLRGPRNRICL